MIANPNPQTNASLLFTEDLLATDAAGSLLPGDRVSIPITSSAVRAVRILNGVEGLSRLELVKKDKAYPSMSRRIKYLLELGSQAVILAHHTGEFKKPTAAAERKIQ